MNRDPLDLGGRRPTIAYLTGEFPRASDTFIQREVTALRSDGFEVRTYAVRRPGPEHRTGPERQALEDTTTYLLELTKGSAGIAAIHRAGLRPLLRAVRLAWATKRPGLRGTLYQLAYLIEAVMLASELRDRNIEHLHNHLADSSCTVAMLASEISGVPYSFTLHGPGIFFEPYTWQLGTKLDRSAFTAAISNFARSQAAIFAQPETMDRVHVIHCGIEPARLQVVDHNGTGTRLIYVGRLVELKGLGILLTTLSELVHQYPELRLTVVGDGPDRARFEKQVAKLKLGSVVEFVGAQSQDEVSDLLAQSDIFVLPSFAEGVPVVIMEAMGSGLPVVSTYVGGITELVDDDIHGFLVAPGDNVNLRDRLTRLIDSAELRGRFGQAGRARVVEHFDSTIEARRLGTVIEASLAGQTLPVRPESALGSEPTEPPNLAKPSAG